MNITDFSLKLNGYPLEKAKKLVREINALSISDYNAFLNKQKQSIVNHHLNNNSFYKSFNIPENWNWETLPVLTKHDLQTPLNKRLSEGFSLKNCYTNKTSGSSGNPFYFAKDKFSHAITWAMFHKWYSWYDIYSKKQARFYGIPKESSTKLKETLKDKFSNRYRFNVFDLSEKAMNSWLKIFSKQKFEFITGYTSVIFAFAEYLVSNNIVLRDVCPTLKACLPTSEMCSDVEKELMHKAFGITIVKEYGAAEFGLIALEKGDKWILNSTNLYIEILDDNNNILPYGKEGRIVITDLFNKAHPFIRYDIGDVGSINMVNDILVLENLIGRKEDYVILPSGKKAPGLSLYYVTKSVMKDDGDVKEIKVVQTSMTNLDVEYIAISELNDCQKEDIKIALNHYLEPEMSVNFIRLDKLQRTKKGKLKQFTSLIK